MYFLRPALRVSFRRIQRPQTTTYRTFATESPTSNTTSNKSFVPPDAKIYRGAPALPHPPSPTYFSGRSTYLDNLYTLERHLHNFSSTLHKLHITPLPRAASHAVGPVPSYWRDLNGMYQILGKGIKETQYRRLINVLGELNRLRHLAVLGGEQTVAAEIMAVIGKYERGDRRERVESGTEGGRKKPKIDEHGRVYALGKRKTSSARVWIVPIQSTSPGTASGSGPTEGSLKKWNASTLPVQPAQILVNGVPAATYFTHSADRERVFRPLKLTGLLTSYNVFCLARGGGTTGQAEAIAMGISRTLQVLEPGAKGIIRQGKLMRRDPRMVERKKTNLAKARKAYAWVKR
ncbi:hypothetical protein M408DRAFT_79169 [Serendipita vermifera MAFF 305830]|uniref:Ribosomal protein S5 C-terminal domain-containing protein n=1 Tax=Serendipita vermifera MAFF 305830 TaxID=933852 RepID=A0A0C2W795_SERVB|nr:hypothetical protein M408DRAFT_79169 [Serendipita vermifera MAFF 305830]